MMNFPWLWLSSAWFCATLPKGRCKFPLLMYAEWDIYLSLPAECVRCWGYSDGASGGGDGGGDSEQTHEQSSNGHSRHLWIWLLSNCLFDTIL